MTYAQRYSFQNLGVDDGLIQSQAICLSQDSTGNLWVGTLGGLSRFDGKIFTNYSIRNGLLSNMVHSIATDKSGAIWIGSRKGLSRFDGAHFQYFPVHLDEPAHVNSSQQLFIGADSVLWRAFGTVYVVAHGKVGKLITPAPAGTVSAFLSEKERIWVASGDTVFQFEKDKWASIPVLSPMSITNLYINEIKRLRNGKVVLATNYGLYVVDSGKAKPMAIGDQRWIWMNARSIAEDKNGAIWVAAGAGVAMIKSGAITWFNRKNGLSDNGFLEVMNDMEGNIWLASDGLGIFRFSGNLFTVLDETMGLPSAQVMAIAERRDSLYIGTWEAGLFVFKDGKITPRLLPCAQTPAISALFKTADGKLWVGTRENGLFQFSNGIFRSYTAPHRGLTSNTIYCMYEMSSHFYIGVATGALEYRNDSFFALPVGNEHVVSFLKIGVDSLLIATEKNGMLLYHNGIVSKFITHTIADSSSINCFTMQEGALWLGSSDNGVIRYFLGDRRATVVNKKNGLRSDFIYNIIGDNNGNIWVGTGYGIHRIHMERDTPKVHFYGRDAGVTGTESNINAVLKLADGSIWFGTTKGAIRYEPRAAITVPAPPAIVLQSVKLLGESSIDSAWYDSTDSWYGVPYHLKLPYRKNNITISFNAITLSGANQLLYRYKMEGIDAPWSEWNSATSVTYSALPPGKYIFVVQSLGSEGSKAPELRYSFEIETPFHKTWWFYMCILFACLVTGVALQAAYSTQKQRRNRLRTRLRAEEQAKIRLRTAEDFHDEVGNKLTRINVLTNILKAKTVDNEDVLRLLSQIQENTAQLYGGTRDILWSLKPTNDNLYEILFRVNDFAGELFQDTEVRFLFSGIQEDWRKHRLPMDMNRNLTMIFKEALNNILKYANAKNVTLVAQMKRRDVCVLVLTDDGRGFDTRVQRDGNGVNNMMVRAGRINGKLYIDSKPGRGTILTLTFRIPRNR